MSGYTRKINTNASANLTLITASSKRPAIYIFFNVLLAPGILWFILELRAIAALSSPTLFLLLLLSIVVGLALTVSTIMLYRLNLIENMSINNFLAVLVPLTLLTAAVASFTIRTV